MRSLLLSFALLLAAASASAQNIVTGTVTDANGNPYANGTVSAQSLVNSGQLPTFTSPIATGGSGAFSLSLANGTYIFTICAPTVNLGPRGNVTPPSVCFTSAPISISSNIDLSTTLSAAAPILGPSKAIASVGASLSADNTFTNNNRFKGPIPFADLSAFTRASASITGCSATATINLGTPTTATISNNTCFQNGDGITIYNAGPAITISTPPAPTVLAAAISIGGTGLGGGTTVNTVVGGAAGASTYLYKLIARDFVGGFTVPGPATTITTGLSSLGGFSCPISTLSRSGRNITVTFTAACEGSVVGAAMLVTGTSPNPPTIFGGFYNVQTVNSSSQVVLAGPYNSAGFGWNSTDNNATQGTNSGTGGTAYFFSSNHLSWAYGAGVWSYYICRQGPSDGGSYKLIGQTKPSTGTYEDIQFDDYGSPMMDSQPFPPYVTNAVCNGASGQNDPLTTTVSSGGGTTILTLANAATNAVTNSTALFDNAPGFQVAATSVSGGTSVGLLSIPASGVNFFVFNSAMTLPSNLSVQQIGRISINETIKIPGGVVWDGAASQQCPAVTIMYYSTGGACIYLGYTNPGFLVTSDVTAIKNVTFNVPGLVNGVTAVVDDAPHTIFSNNQYILSGGATADYLGMAVVIRGDVASADAAYDFEHLGIISTNILTTPGTWTPFIHVPNAQNGSGGIVNSQGIINIDKASFLERGIVHYGAGITWNIGSFVRQEGIMPFAWHLNGNGASDIFNFKAVNLDTDGASVLTSGSNTGIPATTGDFVTANSLADGGGTTFGGFGPAEYNIFESSTTTLPNAHGFSQPCGFSNTASINCDFDSTAHIGPNANLFFPLAFPAGLSATPAAGGSLTSDTFQVAVSAVGEDGKETITSAFSSATTSGTCSGSGNCELSLSWSPVPFAISYNIWACGNTTVPICASGINRQTTGVTATTFTLTSIIQSGIASNSFTQTGQSGHNASIVWSPTVVTVPQAFASLSACSATNRGSQATITDSTTTTWGATITGGGGNLVLAFCDGSAWTVSAK